ncbi:fungal-specific transcription factor domain-containing protein [Kalaharituber pfeilii]|nr:fungal-specific transcription factor domain-containing protein [Kalaharituber pfeilii]
MPASNDVGGVKVNGVVLGGQGGNNTTGNRRKRQRTLVSCTECHRRKQKCDRQWPCGNCTSRSASHLCQYERKASHNRDETNLWKGGNAGTESLHTDESGGDIGEDSEGDLENMAMNTRKNASEFGYTIGIQNTSLNVLEKLDICCNNQLHPVYSDRTFRFSNPTDLSIYNQFIRMIPARPFTNLLVQVFFTEINFLYGTLHQPTFNKLLDEWWLIATSPRSSSDAVSTPILPIGRGFGNDPYLLKDIHFFPSLLLQVQALSIQLLPREHHEYVSQIKLGIGETFHELSSRFSNASCELATLLAGTCTLSLGRVQQAFLRASWLKNEGRMHESWHCLGTAIRSAQEQGLHLESGVRGRAGTGGLLRGVGGMRSMVPNNMADQLKMMWHKEMEKRVWINLYAWDRFMAMLLGRPTMINDKHCTVTPPLDCEIPADLTQHEPTPRGVMDPPTPFTQRILEYRTSYLGNELDEMNQEFAATGTPDFPRLDALHTKIMAFTETFPPEFSITNRDTRHDSLRPFLAVQAALLKCTFFSVLVALHRPYLFIREKSRKEIVRACLIMLAAQDTLVRLLKEHLHRIYAICFFTFDPCVLLAAVIITNCGNMDQQTVEESLVALRAGWRRLRLLGSHVRLAEKGAVVLRVLLRKVELVAERWKWKRDIPIGSGQASSEGSSGGGSSSATNAMSKSPLLPDGVGGISVPRSRSNPRSSPAGRISSNPKPYSRNSGTQLQRQGRRSPENALQVGSAARHEQLPAEINHSNAMLNAKLPHTATFLEAINTSSFNGHNQHHNQTTMPLEWGSTGLIDGPITHDQMGPLPSTTSTLMSGVSSAPFDFGKPTGGGFGGFFNGGNAFPMNVAVGEDSSMAGHGTEGGEHAEWVVPHGDGLWQNLLGIFNPEP